MAQSVTAGDLYVAGSLTAISMNVPSGSVADSQVAAGAAIQATKLVQRREIVHADGSSTAVASSQQTIHVVRGATGTLVAFEAGAVVPMGAGDTCTVDLWKNGSTILSAALSLTSTDAARTLPHAAGFTSTALAAGDWLELKVAYTHSTGSAPQGVTIRLTLDELPQ